MKNTSPRCAVFLDRDGTIILDAGYISNPRDVQLLPGAAEGLLRLQQAGLLLVVVSNQSGVGREMFSEEEMQLVHARMVELLGDEHIMLDGAYYCLHRPEEACNCRKPRPGLLKLAAEELGIRLNASYMVGDALTDVEAGREAGCRSLLIHRELMISPLARIQGKPVETPPEGVPIVPDLIAASKWILDEHAKRRQHRKRSRGRAAESIDNQ